VNPAFRTGDRVEIEAGDVRAVARVRESSDDGRLHIAFEMGEYLPWVDTDVQIRHFGNDPARSTTAKILHAGSSTALLRLAKMDRGQLNGFADLGRPRGPYDTLPLLDE
jgi:hypothetical protein